MADEEERVVLPLIEERMVVGKRKFETGKVRVRTDVEKHIDIARLRLERERVEITRIVKDQEVSSPPPIREQGDLTILSVVEERLVVQKRLVLVEEVHIRRVRTDEEARLPVEVLRQKAVVEREEIRGDQQA